METLAHLRAEIAEAKAALDSLKDKQHELQGIVLAHLDSTGLDSMRMSGFNFHRIRKLGYASKLGTDALVEVCRNNPNYEHVLNVNNPKMKSLLKEMLEDSAGNWIADQNALPKDLQDVLEVQEVVTLGQRAAK
jgi:hypothetical protein